MLFSFVRVVLPEHTPSLSYKAVAEHKLQANVRRATEF